MTLYAHTHQQITHDLDLANARVASHFYHEKLGQGPTRAEPMGHMMNMSKPMGLMMNMSIPLTLSDGCANYA